jgi:hypothetical protein
MTRLTAAAVHRLGSRPLSPRAALEAAVGLGALAGWWLRPEVRTAAAGLQPAWAAHLTQPPRLTATLGGCPIALVNRGPLALPLLRPAFLLPVRWRQHPPHDPALPQMLRGLADRVVRQLSEAAGPGLRRWGLSLDLGPGGEEVDLSDLEMSFESAWAPLAGGLLLAEKGIASDPGTWATGAWDAGGGVGPVEGLGAKLSLAAEYGVRHFFLPLAQRAEAEAWLADTPGSGVRLGWLVPSPDPQPEALLRPYLARLGWPPGRDEPFEARRRYYALQPRGRPAAEHYYRECLLPEIAARLRAQAGASWPGWRPELLVTVLSPSAALVRLMAEALRVPEVMLLVEGGQEAALPVAADAVRDELGRAGARCVVARFDEASIQDMEDRFSCLIQEAAGGRAAESLAIDLTPGKKPMTVALARAAPGGSWLLYCRHSYLADGRPAPGTEALERWPAAPHPASH